MAKTKRDGAAGATKDAAAGATIKVRATQVGFYGDVRRRIGDVFLLYPRHGVFTELELDEKTGKPLLDDADLVKHRVTKEVEKTLTAEEQFNPKWMEKVAADTPERASTARDVIQQEHDDVLRQRMAGGGGAPADVPSGDEDVLT
jgi:hypothetical protein